MQQFDDEPPEDTADMAARVMRQSVLRKIKLGCFDQALATVMQRAGLGSGAGFYPDESIFVAVIRAFHSGKLSSEHAVNLLSQMLEIDADLSSDAAGGAPFTFALTAATYQDLIRIFILVGDFCGALCILARLLLDINRYDGLQPAYVSWLRSSLSNNNAHGNNGSNMTTAQLSPRSQPAGSPGRALDAFLMTSRTVCIDASETCPHCRRSLDEEEVRAGWAWDNNPNSYTTVCPACNGAFIARFSVEFGRHLGQSSQPAGDHDDVFLCEFLPLPALWKELKALRHQTRKHVAQLQAQQQGQSTQNKRAVAIHGDRGHDQGGLPDDELPTYAQAGTPVAQAMQDFEAHHHVLYWNLVWNAAGADVPLHALLHGSHATDWPLVLIDAGDRSAFGEMENKIRKDSITLFHYKDSAKLLRRDQKTTRQEQVKKAKAEKAALKEELKQATEAAKPERPPRNSIGLRMRSMFQRGGGRKQRNDRQAVDSSPVRGGGDGDGGGGGLSGMHNERQIPGGHANRDSDSDIENFGDAVANGLDDGVHTDDEASPGEKGEIIAGSNRDRKSFLRKAARTLPSVVPGFPASSFTKTRGGFFNVRAALKQKRSASREQHNQAKLQQSILQGTLNAARVNASSASPQPLQVMSLSGGSGRLSPPQQQAMSAMSQGEDEDDEDEDEDDEDEDDENDDEDDAAAMQQQHINDQAVLINSHQAEIKALASQVGSLQSQLQAQQKDAVAAAVLLRNRMLQSTWAFSKDLFVLAILCLAATMLPHEMPSSFPPPSEWTKPPSLQDVTRAVSIAVLFSATLRLFGLSLSAPARLSEDAQNRVSFDMADTSPNMGLLAQQHAVSSSSGAYRSPAPSPARGAATRSPPSVLKGAARGPSSKSSSKRNQSPKVVSVATPSLPTAQRASEGHAWELDRQHDLGTVWDVACDLMGPYDAQTKPNTDAYHESLKSWGWDTRVVSKSFSTGDHVQLWTRKLPGGLRLLDHLSALRKGEVPATSGKLMQWNLVVGVYKNMDASKVHRVFLNLDYRKQWDKYTLEAKVIDRGVATDTDVVYQSTKFPFPFSNRDYVFSRLAQEDHTETGGHVQATVGLDHPDGPVRDGYVRAERYEQCICARQRGPDTELMMLFVQETGLRLPERLKRWAASSGFPVFFETFRDAIRAGPN